MHLRWVPESKAWREVFGAMYTHLLFASRGGDDMRALYEGDSEESRSIRQQLE